MLAPTLQNEFLGHHILLGFALSLKNLLIISRQGVARCFECTLQVQEAKSSVPTLAMILKPVCNTDSSMKMDFYRRAIRLGHDLSIKIKAVFRNQDLGSKQHILI